MSTKQVNVDILLGLGFTVVNPTKHNESVSLDCSGVDQYGDPVVQAVVYPNQAGTWSVSLDGGFLAPAYENEDILIKRLDEDFPGWR